MNDKKSLVTGFVAGVVATLVLAVLLRSLRPGPEEGVIAHVGDEKLSLSELRKNLASDFVPVENDEYQILKQGVEEWVNRRLLEKAAKDAGTGLKELYKKELWSQVQVSPADLSDYYNKNRELFKEPFEEASPQILQELRRQKYAGAKENYLKDLAKKYQAKIYLEKPESYVEGLGISASLLEKRPPSKAAPKPSARPSGGERAPSRGSEEAPVLLEEFADFHCSFCQKVKATLEKLFENYPGKIQWVFRHFPLTRTPGTGSFLTHEASVCAQDQGKFWEYHDAIFARPASPTKADLETMAQDIGLDLTQFRECLASGKHQNFLQKEVKDGTQKGVEGTPTMFLNDQTVGGAYPYEHFAGVVESLLHPGAAPPVAEEAPPRPLAAGPVEFKDLEGRPSRGPKDAPVTLVEFSDFHCPFCQRVTPTLEKIENNYPGKIRRVWRHYPLSFHQGADRTHEASECAHEQGKFWEYHDKLFASPGEERDDTALVRLAGQAGLNKKKFEKCLSGGKYKSLIQEEITAGNQAGVEGTPAVFVNGELVSGAQPYESFDQIVKTKLAKSS